jgi:hypothetical protein
MGIARSTFYDAPVTAVGDAAMVAEMNAIFRSLWLSAFWRRTSP